MPPRGDVKVAVATPLPLTAMVPSAVWPLKNVTVPLSVEPGVAATVAVSVTDWPRTTVVGAAVSVVAVGARFTVSWTGAALLLGYGSTPL